MLSSPLLTAAQLIRSEIQVIGETHVRSFSTTVRCLRRILFSNGVSFAWNLLFPHQKSGFQVHLLATFWSQLLCLGPFFSHLGTVTSVSFEIVRIGPVLRYVEPLYEKRLDNDTKKFRN